MSEREHESGSERSNERNTPPVAGRPHMPGYGILDSNSGRGLLPWSWASERLIKARTYWLGTARPDGRPHSMPVWGIWIDYAFYFSTGNQSRKARNLAANPVCTVSTHEGDDAVVLEGSAYLINDSKLIRRFATEYGSKYDWNMDGFEEPIYEFTPTVAFGFSSAPGEFTGSATRWVFQESSSE